VPISARTISIRLGYRDKAIVRQCCDSVACNSLETKYAASDVAVTSDRLFVCFATIYPLCMAFISREDKKLVDV
jgi:hypothetical protein